MFVLFIVLNKVDYLDDVLEALVKQGVRGATIFDSKGLAGAVVHRQMESIPLFGSFKTIIDGAHPYNNTIFTVVSESILDDVVKAVQKVLSEVKHPGAGFMFTVPVGAIYDLGYKQKKN
ncbi:MAG: hypothetical protein M0R05_04105 [Bacilli bacterium]|nr:hypothetical protein [Bacilli bacterium]MDD4076665.1 P-II family nitrogen regulator [Bacilli bacterium]MDD4388281.1 P-II family nitrogen regulator [Bacilli bacterium]